MAPATITKEKEYTSFAVKTASGKDSAARGVNVSDDSIEIGGVSKRVSDAITSYVVALAQEKALKEEKELHSGVIRAFAKKIRTYFIKKGDYQKTFRLFGKQVKKMQYAVDVLENDKFDCPKKNEDIQMIKKLIGDVAFEQIFEESVSIAIKDSVMKSDTLRRELSKSLYEALGADGIKKYFDRETVWSVKKGLSETIHTYDEKIQLSLREHLK